MTTPRNLASDANAAIDQWELKIQNAHATREQQESLSPVGRQSMATAEQRQERDDDDAGRDLAHWPHGWYIPVTGVVALFAVCYLGWLALPRVLSWLLELPIWYR